MEELLEQYFDVFGDNYPLTPTMQLSNDEIIASIKRCLETHTPAEPMDYDMAYDY